MNGRFSFYGIQRPNSPVTKTLDMSMYLSPRRRSLIAGALQQNEEYCERLWPVGKTNMAKRIHWRIGLLQEARRLVASGISQFTSLELSAIIFSVKCFESEIFTEEEKMKTLADFLRGKNVLRAAGGRSLDPRAGDLEKNLYI